MCGCDAIDMSKSKPRLIVQVSPEQADQYGSFAKKTYAQKSTVTMRGSGAAIPCRNQAAVSSHWTWGSSVETNAVHMYPPITAAVQCVT